MSKFVNKFMALSIVAVMTGTSFVNFVSAESRDIGSFESLTVYYKKTVHLQARKKIHNGKAAINLSKDSGSAWIHAYIKTSKNDANSDNYGQCIIQRGQRVTFSTSAKKGKKYVLGLKKEYNSNNGVTIVGKGSWCPDCSK